MKNGLLENIAIIDGASTSAYLAPAFRAYGVKCTHILSSPRLPQRLKKQLNSADYVRNVVHDGDIGQTVDQLRDLNLSAILPGMDPGVELAAELSEALRVPYRNTLGLARARRHKFAQIETLKQANVRTPDHFLSDSAEEVVQWARSHGSLPVVVKPTRGSSVKGVKVCRTLDQVFKAAQAVLSMESSYEETQSEVVVESFSDGQEYIVDSVSFDGRHKIVNIWEVERDRTSSPRLEKMLVVDHTESRYEPVIHYARQVLDAVGLHYGPSHMEIMVTSAGPTIVELNSRLHGSLDPRLTSAVMGQNHVSATVDAFVNPMRFLQSVDEQPRFSGHCGHILLLSQRSGTLVKEFAWASVEALTSCVGVSRWVHKGDRLTKTTDLRSALGMAAVFADHFDTLIDDWRAIRSIEDRFFADPEALTD